MLSEEELRSVLIKQFFKDLHHKLPIDDELFCASLCQYGLLPEDNYQKISKLKTRAQKVAHLMNDIVLPGPEEHLPNLLKVMTKCGNLDVKNFAAKIRKAIGLGRIYLCGKCLLPVKIYGSYRT